MIFSIYRVWMLQLFTANHRRHGVREFISKISGLLYSKTKLIKKKQFCSSFGSVIKGKQFYSDAGIPVVTYKDSLSLTGNCSIYYLNFFLLLISHSTCTKNVGRIGSSIEMMQRDHAVCVEGHWPFIHKVFEFSFDSVLPTSITISFLITISI